MRKGILLVGLLVALLGVFTFAGVDSSAAEAMNGNEFVNVESNSDYVCFEPSQDAEETGLIFIAQDGVEKEAYAVAGVHFAEDGYTVYVLNAGAGCDEVEEIAADNPQIATWAIGGHGQGGNTAAEIVANNSCMVEDGIITGLLLWGADASTVDLTDFTDDNGCELCVMTIYSSDDGITTVSEIRDLRDLLPDETSSYVYISGGNNSNFANYGLLDGDNNVAMDVEDQQEIVFKYSEKLLHELNGGGSFSISTPL